MVLGQDGFMARSSTAVGAGGGAHSLVSFCLSFLVVFLFFFVRVRASCVAALCSLSSCLVPKGYFPCSMPLCRWSDTSLLSCAAVLFVFTFFVVCFVPWV